MRIPALLLTLLLSLPAVADTVQIRPDAPDHHVVVKGDTLWDISAKFLNTPWKWPELWETNKAEIKNPHLIYPGDVIYLIMTDKGPRFSKLQTVKLSPEIHSALIPNREAAIPVIDPKVIAPFIANAGVIDPDSVASMPRVLGTDDDRVLLMIGDTAYATEGDGKTKQWFIVRPGADLIDPDTGVSLGKEAIHVGDATTLVQGSPQTLRIERATMEILKGDRLIAAQPTELAGIEPRSPAKAIEGKLISAYGGVNATAQYATVVINKGRRDGLEPGHVLAVYRTGKVIGGKSSSNEVRHRADLTLDRRELVEYKNFGEEVVDFLDPFDFFFKAYPDGRRGWRYASAKCLKQGAEIAPMGNYDPSEVMADCPNGQATAGSKWAYMDIGCLKNGKNVSFDQPFDPKEVYTEHCRPEAPIKLPDVRSGLVLVYRVFDRVAYALVMESAGPIYLLDSVRNP